MEAIFDLPMVPNDLQQVRCVGLRFRQACDPVSDLNGPFPTDDAFARQFKCLFQARPFGGEG